MELKVCPQCKKEIGAALEACPECGYLFEKTVESEADIKEAVADQQTAVKDQSSGSNVDTIDQSFNSGQDFDGEENTYNQQGLSEMNNVFTPIQPAEPMIKDEKKKLNIGLVLNVVLAVGLVICIAVAVSTNGKLSKAKSQKEYLNDENVKLTENNSALTEENSELQSQIEELQAENDELENGASSQLSDIKNAYESKEWSEVVELAAALHEEYNGSAEDKEAQKLAKSSKNKIAEAKAKKAAEEAKGYETGITYDQLARTPDKYENKKVKFYGKVLQVIEGDGTTQIRLAVNDNYDTVLLAEFSDSVVTSRILEDDHITIYGTSVGTISYESTMGGTITIPGVSVKKIKQ